MTTYVLDSGALIALERRKPRGRSLIQLAARGAAVLVVPQPVLAEWWRGRTDLRDEILASVIVDNRLAATLNAGVALGRLVPVDARLTIDAIVIATAALLGAVVATSDVDDFARFAPMYPGVRVLAI